MDVDDPAGRRIDDRIGDVARLAHEAEHREHGDRGLQIGLAGPHQSVVVELEDVPMAPMLWDAPVTVNVAVAVPVQTGRPLNRSRHSGRRAIRSLTASGDQASFAAASDWVIRIPESSSTAEGGCATETVGQPPPAVCRFLVRSV
jgi:hypothetical protein